MKIKDVLHRDPASHPLVNQGQARIGDDRNDRAVQELRGELSTFVCEGQYADGIQKIIRSFLDDFGRTSQRGAWVSGFYGSGKSHLLKMLCHLWNGTRFEDGATARSLVPALPEDLRDLLRELDGASKRAGGLLAAAGSLPSGTTDAVRLTILSILLRAAGLPEQYSQARFCLWLRSQGYFEQVKSALDAGGRLFEREVNNLYVSGALARAVMDCDPKFAAGEAEAKQLFKAQFPPQAGDITTEDFLRTAREVLRLVGQNSRMPCTLLILDEVQQYIDRSNERSVLVTEVAEAVSKQLDSHVMIVGAGQSALTDAPLLAKMLDRFTIRVPLSDAEVETVTRRVLLQKKAHRIKDVRDLLEVHAGEVSRQLQGTRIGERVEDRSIIVDDYPLLPVRRRFWENCFRQIDAAGTSSQLRSQLRIIHDAVAKLSERPLGAVVPADELFEALAPEMVNTGVLLREINERIIKVGESEGALARRICGLVFLIGKLKREGGADVGVRATRDHIADLLVDNLAGDNGKLRSSVEAALAALTQQGVLMLVADEYRLQTREGSEWDQEFGNRRTKLQHDEARTKFEQDRFIYAEVDRIVRGIRIPQGEAKEPREFLIYRETTPPPSDGAGVPVWIRDGWSCSEKEMLDAARRAGSESATLFVFVPRQSAQDLRDLIAEADAAKQTLDARGNPATAEGQEARQSMEGRLRSAEIRRDRLVREIVANTKVFQGGGSGVFSLTFDLRLKDAAEASLVRLFPRFREADSPAWAAVIKRAKDGADQPFQPAGHTDATEKHPVCAQVLATIGAGKTGTEIRKALKASPFGWPRDAVDAALIALHRAQHVTARLNQQPVPLGQLDQAKIAKAEFRVERAPLALEDRLKLRKLFGLLDMACKSGEEALKAGEFLSRLLDLAQAAGGAPPLPEPPPTAEIEDMRRLVGNEQLVAIKDKAPELETRIQAWTELRALAQARKPQWDVVEKLALHAREIDGARTHLDQVAAIREQRLLLEKADPAASARVGLAGLLREHVQSLHAAQQAAYDRALRSLSADASWSQLNDADREAIRAAAALAEPAKADLGTDELLVAALDAKPLAAMQAEIDAFPSRAARAIEQAARLLEPKVQPLSLERATLHDAGEIDAWLGRQRARLLEAVANGPVLVS